MNDINIVFCWREVVLFLNAKELSWWSMGYINCCGLSCYSSHKMHSINMSASSECEAGDFCMILQSSLSSLLHHPAGSSIWALNKLTNLFVSEKLKTWVHIFVLQIFLIFAQSCTWNLCPCLSSQTCTSEVNCFLRLSELTHELPSQSPVSLTAYVCTVV